MDNNDIIEDFANFVERMEDASYILDCIIRTLQKRIQNLDNSKGEIAGSLQDVEKIFFCISHLPAKIDYLINEIYENQIYKDLIQINNDSKKEIHYINNIRVLPIYPDEDIYVEEGFQIQDLAKPATKPKLKLVIKNQNNDKIE